MYKKGDLRKALEKKMQEYWKDPKIKVKPMEFARMLKTYCEKFGLPDEIRRAKELEEPRCKHTSMSQYRRRFVSKLPTLLRYSLIRLLCKPVPFAF